jgi:hypothetical protein
MLGRHTGRQTHESGGPFSFPCCPINAGFSCLAGDEAQRTVAAASVSMTDGVAHAAGHAVAAGTGQMQPWGR